jgi:cytochrome b6-f complex iron-sulfur subunit
MEKTETPISRAAFLRSLGLSSAALMSIYCLGTVTTSCSSKKEDPAPNPGPGPGGQKVDFTLDLTTPSNDALNTNGGYIYPKDTSIIVARTKNGNFIALSKVCTHQGTTVNFQSANDQIHCPNHGSNFNTDGTVKNGPAATALKKYNTTLTGTNLRVYES